MRPELNQLQLRLEAAKGEITKLLNERYHTVDSFQLIQLGLLFLIALNLCRRKRRGSRWLSSTSGCWIKSNRWRS